MKLRQSMRDTLRFFTCGAERWLAVFFLIYPLYAEQVACAGLLLPLTAEKALLALALGAGIALCANLPRRPALGFAAAAVLCCAVSLMHISQFIYWNIFQTPYFLRSAQGLGAALEFWRVAVAEAVQNTGYLILYAAQPVVLFTWVRRVMLRRRRRGRAARLRRPFWRWRCVRQPCWRRTRRIWPFLPQAMCLCPVRGALALYPLWR